MLRRSEVGMRKWFGMSAVFLGACGTPANAIDENPSGDHDTDVSPDTAETEETGETADTSETNDTEDTGCPPVTDETVTAIVTDIDETMTTADSEWLAQLADPTHDPAMRPEANELMWEWHERGYRIFYVTARGEDFPLLDGSSSREATMAWLDAHDFPYESEQDVFLSSAFIEFDPAGYKTEVLSGLQDQGFELVYAYGNADTDIEAYKAVGIPNAEQFLVGDLAGTLEVTGITNEDAYANHRLDWPELAPCGH